MDLWRREHSFYPRLYLSPPYRGALCPPRTWEGKQFSVDCASGFWVGLFHWDFFYAISTTPSPPDLVEDSQVLLALVSVDRTFEYEKYEIAKFATLFHPER